MSNASISTSATLILYVRPHCHLCLQASALLSSLAVSFMLVNVDTQPSLQTQYGALVPVLYAPWCDQELVFPFDEARCRQWLNTLPTARDNG